MKECYQYTDLEWRLSKVPDSAACRGVFFNMLDERAAEFGPVIQAEYRNFFGIYRFPALRLFPVKDYLTRIVKLAQLQFGGPNIYRGIFDLQAASWPAFRRTLIGRATFGILGNDFRSLLLMSKRGVEKAINYATFEVEGGPEHFTTRHRNEYVYIEHAMAGGIVGLAKACGVRVHVEPRLVDPFNGDLIVDVEQPAFAAAQ